MNDLFLQDGVKTVLKCGAQYVRIKHKFCFSVRFERGKTPRPMRPWSPLRSGCLVSKKNLTLAKVSVLLFLFFISQHIYAESLRIAPNFTLPELLNPSKTISLSDYENQVVLVDFWASWCHPCQESLPAYNTLRNKIVKKLGPGYFEILAINVDLKKEEALHFLKTMPLDFPILREDTGKTQREYIILGMPTAFLVNAQGEIHLQFQGYHSDMIEKLASEIVDLINLRE